MANNLQNVEKMRHSASHVLAQAVLKLYPDTKLGIGPAIDNGFYYDLEFSQPLLEEDLAKIEKEMHRIVEANLPIVQVFKSRDEAEEFYSNWDQPYKLELLKDIEDKELSFFVNGEGEFVDLCRGPHVESTGQIKAFKLDKLAGAYWRGDEDNKMLTRIYALAFETQEELDAYIKTREEAEKRDHRKLGPQLGIYFFDETAPGMPYWLPKGTVIVNEIMNYWRIEQRKNGYQETITPSMSRKELYVTSGHWDHYKDFMFTCENEEGQTYCVKPMNCPNAMTIYKHTNHSYREFPIRYAHFDPLHRHEKAGELNGLLRVQKFEQDDSHIFVREDQIAEEFQRVLDMAVKFYEIFDIKFRVRVGTRPDDFMGDIETWNKAEASIKKILEDAKVDYSISEGDGAFYGPKADILMKDCMGREHQTGTVQLDFQLPKNFELKYTDKDGLEKQPVVIHRAICGSLERFIGILIEHFGGAFPLWVSPIQARIVTIADRHSEYANLLKDEMLQKGFRADVDDRSERLPAKVRDAEMEKVPYILIVGDKEVETRCVSVRPQGKKDLGMMSFDNFVEMARREIDTKGKAIVGVDDDLNRKEIKAKIEKKD